MTGQRGLHGSVGERHLEAEEAEQGLHPQTGGHAVEQLRQSPLGQGLGFVGRAEHTEEEEGEEEELLEEEEVGERERFCSRS